MLAKIEELQGMLEHSVYIYIYIITCNMYIYIHIYIYSDELCSVDDDSPGGPEKHEW